MAVANVYQPTKRSSIIENGIPAIANPSKYPYPQSRFFNAIIIVGIIVVKIIDKYDQICIELKIINIFHHETIKPIIIKTTVPILNLNSGSGLPTLCTLSLL